MPFDPATGRWINEDDNVASRVTALTTAGSPLMTAARTSGLQTANRRGLLNASMAAGASEGAALAAATPIASQDAQQAYGRNNQGTAITADRDAAQVQIGANKDRDTFAATTAADRDKFAATTAADAAKLGREQELLVQRNTLDAASRQQALAAALEANQQYSSTFANLAGNAELPAATREQYLTNLLAVRGSAADTISKLYGLNLDWGSAVTGTVSSGTTFAPTVGVAPTGNKSGSSGSASNIAQTILSPISTKTGRNFLSTGLLGGLFG